MTRMIILEKWNAYASTLPPGLPEILPKLIKIAFYSGFVSAVALKIKPADIAEEALRWQAELEQMHEQERLREMTRY